MSGHIDKALCVALNIVRPRRINIFRRKSTCFAKNQYVSPKNAISLAFPPRKFLIKPVEHAGRGPTPSVGIGVGGFLATLTGDFMGPHHPAV